MVLHYIIKKLIKLVNYLIKLIEIWFNKNRLKFLNYPSVTGFLSSIYDINVSDPKLKKKFIDPAFDLGLDLWLGYMIHDGVILTILCVLVYPRVFLKYMLFWFWIDLFYAQAYNFGHIFYAFNLSLLFPAFSCWFYKKLNRFLGIPAMYLTELIIIFISQFRFINLATKISLYFSKKK